MCVLKSFQLNEKKGIDKGLSHGPFPTTFVKNSIFKSYLLIAVLNFKVLNKGFCCVGNFIND